MLRRIEHLTSTEIAALVVADADEDEVVVVPVLIVVVDDESDEVVEVDTVSGRGANGISRSGRPRTAALVRDRHRTLLHFNNLAIAI